MSYINIAVLNSAGFQSMLRISNSAIQQKLTGFFDVGGLEISQSLPPAANPQLLPIAGFVLAKAHQSRFRAAMA
jgi:hypothetical protein